MVKIRLSRTGKKGYANYKIVVIEAKEKRESHFIEQVGFYNPHTKELELKAERIEYWLKCGAQPTDTTKFLLIKKGVLKKSEKAKKEFKKAPGKQELERREAKAKKAEAPKAE